MKKISFFTLLAGLSFLGLTAPHAASSPTRTTEEPFVYAREATLSQIYRYGREMYRIGNYPEAIAAFKRMIIYDCRNALAHYHLQQISKKEPRFNYLTNYLKNLSCLGYDFLEEDFLPAGALYEKDAALLKAQLAAYSQRVRHTKIAMMEHAKTYDTEVAGLEKELQDASKVLLAARDEKKATLAATEKMNEVLNVSQRISAEIARLQQDIFTERKQYQQQLLELNTTLLTKEQTLAAQEQIITSQKQPALSATIKTSSPDNTPLPQTLLTEQDAALVTLQDKFNAIQERLKLIETSIREKNRQLDTLTNDLNAIRN